MVDYFRVRNWKRFQHYGDRQPPWIKLYCRTFVDKRTGEDITGLLDNYEFGCLRDASKAHAVCIWVLASKHENRLPYDSEWIGKQIQATEKVDLKALESAGFIEVYDRATSMLATCPDIARPEYRVQKESCAPSGTHEKRAKKAQKSSKEKTLKPPPPPTGATRLVWFYRWIYSSKYKTLPDVSWGKDGSIFKAMTKTIGVEGVRSAIVEMIKRPPKVNGDEVSALPASIKGFHTKLATRKTYKENLERLKAGADIEAKLDAFVAENWDHQ